MRSFQDTCEYLRLNPKTWLITGVSGFIGSNLLEFLLNLDQYVIGIDNFATGSKMNINNVTFLNIGGISNETFIDENHKISAKNL